MSSHAPPVVPENPLRGRRVLVVEDDPTVREVACEYLRAAGFAVDAVASGGAALRAVHQTPPDLVVLDRMLPGVDGLDVCRRLRSAGTTPVLLLTALGAPEQRIEGFEAGADDYLVKPFSPRELVLRVASILRRTIADPSPDAPIELGDFCVDPASRVASRGGRRLTLAAREFDLLAFFVEHPNQVFRRDELLRSVWGWDFGDLSTVTVHVRRIREKIEDEPTRPRFLVTVWGVGYRFDADGAAA